MVRNWSRPISLLDNWRSVAEKVRNSLNQICSCPMHSIDALCANLSLHACDCGKALRNPGHKRLVADSLVLYLS